MYCTQCGASIGEKEIRCPYCGAVNPFADEQKYMERLQKILQETEALSYADLHLDYPNRKIICNGQDLVLTAREAELLSVLMKQPKTAFSREQLVLKVWGSNADIEPGNVDNYISFLRKRLRELHSSCEIKTIYGAGYRLEKSNA